MSRFMDLPNELILEILQRVSAADVEAFCQLSKSVHTLTKSFLQNHRKLKRKYWTWSNETHPNKPLRFATLLSDILHNPRVTGYITRLHFSGSTVNTKDEALIKLCRKAIQSSEMLSDAEKRLWLEGRHKRSSWEGQCVALMLSLLPNLEKLRLWSCGIRPVSKMMIRITKTKPKGLQKLKAVDIDGNGEEEERNAGMAPDGYRSLLECLMTLPSLEQMSIGNLSVSDPDEDPSRLSRTWNSSIARICLNECISACPIILTVPTRLECLTSFTCYWGFDSPDIPTPEWLCTALLRQAGSTLKDLKLIHSMIRSTLVGSLREFKVLEHVAMNRELLINENCSSWAHKLPMTILSLDIYDNGYRTENFELADPRKLTNDSVKLLEDLLSIRAKEMLKLEKVQYMPHENMVDGISDGIVKLMKYYLEREFCNAGIQFTLLEDQPGYFFEECEMEEVSGWSTTFT